ncbi:glycosyltransferase family 4 protein [Ornithinimicrobium kibberense]|uniref:Glycosyltransferase family 4 protein n=1 Tax=Ornithinimicrobium kibberense TaxID=282060 RepID=A0ABV5V1Q4_9MICO|nr:glycosyltransferase family 4 protein [Ornithinimicrobium kibberense]
MIILQISPEFEAGTGVGGVVHCLEEAWRGKGHDVRRFGPEEAGLHWLTGTGSGMVGRLRHMVRVIAFSTVGTARAKRAITQLPDDAVVICHNDALVGDVYVNHGILEMAMRARGHYRWRMVRNPLHLFTAARDRVRYRANVHRVVVNLTRADEDALRRVYSRIAPRTVVIGNGVDIGRFRPPTPEERLEARSRLDLDPESLVTVFVGNEFERKGLFPLVEAVSAAHERHHLVVVGGTPDMLDHLGRVARQHGLDRRLHAVGPHDPLPYLWAADLLAQPSAYESYGLVVTEALAAGVPVLSTPVGVAPDVIDDGSNGFLTDGSAQDIAAALARLSVADLPAMRLAARQSVAGHTWDRISDTYLGLFADLVRAEVS